MENKTLPGLIEIKEEYCNKIKELNDELSLITHDMEELDSQFNSYKTELHSFFNNKVYNYVDAYIVDTDSCEYDKLDYMRLLTSYDFIKESLFKYESSNQYNLNQVKQLVDALANLKLANAHFNCHAGQIQVDLKIYDLIRQGCNILITYNDTFKNLNEVYKTYTIKDNYNYDNYKELLSKYNKLYRRKNDILCELGKQQEKLQTINERISDYKFN